ncbi:hypothetical protein [Mesorhizobium sp.]|uniref:hypothetical protein n=1 Tax=Mesorhizobium sp. TaxID=1871066 RepID=UPI0011F89A5B|nr:hypothetical protein [Mesorhizobium sp.]TIM04509.1 MAG: hypothetical protein E5Y62_31550 [Mesorhizobium sp.]
MQRNKVHHVYTVERVARDLSVSEALIQELPLSLDPEDGVIWVYGANDDDGILAFTQVLRGAIELADVALLVTHARALGCANERDGLSSSRTARSRKSTAVLARFLSGAPRRIPAVIELDLQHWGRRW